VGYWLREVEALTGEMAVYPLNMPAADNYFYHQLGIAPLPKIADLFGFKTKLYDDYQIEIPQTEWHDMQFLRIAIQAYNTQADVDKLLEAMADLLPQFAAEWWGR
jgi:isopenicillin-N epimerase